MPFDFENFPVYKIAFKLNSEISAFLEELPDKNNYSIKDQLSRASMSILLNIAEGSGRYTKPDKRSFYINARGSCYECAACLQILKSRELISENIYNKFYEGLNDIAKQLSALIKI